MSREIAKEPFRFYTSSLLKEITGKKASHLKDFVEIFEKIDESSVFYHTHHIFREYNFAPGKYSSDFTRWIAEDIEESGLAEKLNSLNILDYNDINSIRNKIVETIKNHLNQAVDIRKAPAGREFYFLSGITVVAPTRYEAKTLEEFVHAINNIGMRSLYYHFFDARFRLGRKTNDFSNWIRASLGNEELAKKIEALDPYLMTMDQLRNKIVSLCSARGKEVFDFRNILAFIKRIIGG